MELQKAESAIPKPYFNFRQRLSLLQLGIPKWKIPTHMTADELFVLSNLVKGISRGTLVEIGSYMGASSFMLAKSMSRNSVLYCIDTWQNEGMTEGHKDTYGIFMANIHPVKDRIRPIRKRSEDAVTDVPDNIDFIFIDGDHSYEGVKKDFKLWLPKMKPGGIMVFHDSGWAEGVQQLIREDILPRYPKTDSLPNMFWVHLP